MKPRQIATLLIGLSGCIAPGLAKDAKPQKGPPEGDISIPKQWEFSAPLIAPEKRTKEPSHAQKDPTVVQFDGKWHVFMTAKLPNRTVIETCSFTDWEEADQATRTILDLTDSTYYGAPQVFYFEPQHKWYLIYQLSSPGAQKMWLAYSTTNDISDPNSWTPAQPILDGGKEDPRVVGGLDYWIICDEKRAYFFFTDLKGHMWRMWTKLENFPKGFDHCELALKAKIYEASHTYRLKGTDKYLTIIEQDGRRHFKAYLADRLDGEWSPLADTEQAPFAGAANIQPAPGVEAWTDNISHGELIRTGVNQNLEVDPNNLQMLFQGMMQEDKKDLGYGKYSWRIGLLTPKE